MAFLLELNWRGRFLELLRRVPPFASGAIRLAVPTDSLHDNQLLSNRRLHLVARRPNRGDFKQSQYGRVILLFTILRRPECVLESSQPKVLERLEKLKDMKKLEEGARRKLLLKAAGQSFYASPMDLSPLGGSDIKCNLLTRNEQVVRSSRIVGSIYASGIIEEMAGPARGRQAVMPPSHLEGPKTLSARSVISHSGGLVVRMVLSGGGGGKQRVNLPRQRMPDSYEPN